MKNIASSLVVLGVVLLVASSCFFSETPNDIATLRLVIEKPTDRTTYDCYAINVIGPGIRTFDPRFPPPPNPEVLKDDSKYCFYPGIGSKLVGLDVDDNAIIEVGVPVGSPRLVQVVGIDTTDNLCPEGTFSEVWKDKSDSSGKFSTVNNDAIYQVGRGVVNLPPGTREKQLEIPQLTNTLKQFGKGYCDPPSGGSGGGLNFQSFVSSIFAERSLAGYVTNGTGPYQFTVTPQGGGTSVTYSEFIQFGGTHTSLDVVASDLTTLKNGTGTITVQGFKTGSPAVPDQFLYLWMAPDPTVLATDRSTWSPHFAAPGGLTSPPMGVIEYSAKTTLLSSGTPRNHRALTLMQGVSNAAHVATSFFPDTEQWDDLLYFVVFRPNPSGENQIFCLSSDATVPCISSSTVASFLGVRADFGKIKVQGCLGCNLLSTNEFKEKEVTASNIFYALGVRINGTKMKYSLSGFGGSTTNDEAPLSGTFDLSSAVSAHFGLGKYDNDGDTDISEVLVYRHLTGPSAFTPMRPCDYINAKYGANMSCTHLNSP